MNILGNKIFAVTNVFYNMQYNGFGTIFSM